MDDATIEHILAKGRTEDTVAGNALSDRWARLWDADRVETVQMFREAGTNGTNIVDGMAHATGLPLSHVAPTRLANPTTVRERVVGMMLANDMNLRTHEFYLHGTSTRITNEATQLGHRGVDYFTAVDPRTAVVFGQRNIGKAGGGDLAGVLLMLEAPAARQLERSGLALTREVHDMPGHLETIFRGGSATVVNNRGRFEYLPPRFFQE